MPIPKPREDESKDDFISRCMSNETMKDEFPDTDQRNAVCYDSWRKNKKTENSKRKVLFHLSAKLHKMPINFSEKDDFEEYATTMIVGDGTYNGVYFPKDELAKAAQSFEGVPINLNHNDDTIEDIVGYVKNVQYRNGSLMAQTILDKRTEKYDTATGFIKSREDAGDKANVSIGVWLEIEEEKLNDGEDTRMTARNLDGDHLAIVVHGACNPEDGCGIGIESLSAYIYESPGEYIINPYGYSIKPNVDDEITINVKEETIENIYKELIKKERLKYD